MATTDQSEMPAVAVGPPCHSGELVPMSSRLCVAVMGFLLVVACGRPTRAADDVIPPLARIKPDRPRLLLRPTAAEGSRLAVSLAELRATPRDRDFDAMLDQLRGQNNAAAQAMVWLLTGDAAAAERAVRRMRDYRYPGKVDTFHVYGRLTEFALAYDWLHDWPPFDRAARDAVRANAAPLAAEGLRAANDHVFHNYVWMSAGGVGLWALATAGEDEAADRVFGQIRDRFNHGLYPAWQYLDGLPSEPMGYWSLYVFTPGVWTLLAAQSATEADLVGAVRGRGDWLDRNFETLIQFTLPDMRYVPWGDLQSGPNGGVTRDMAGVIDACTWAMRSGHGLKFGQWLAAKQGLRRFRAETAIFYMLYTRRLGTGGAGGAGLATQPGDAAAWPPLSYLAGNRNGGQFIARSGWDDDATVVGFRCADHYGDHHHYDQGSFLIYRRGLLAVDPPVYRQVRGPQQKTEVHNTLLVGGRPQRPVRGQWFATVEAFRKNLEAGRKLETGDILFHRDAGAWAAVAGQFAQAYDVPELQSCVRQLLYARPGTVVVVDRLAAVSGKQLPEIQWLLQVPAEPRLGRDEEGLTASNGRSWLRCQSVFPGGGKPAVEPTPVNTRRVAYTYGGGADVVLVHVLEVGDETEAGPAVGEKVNRSGRDVAVVVDGRAFVFEGEPAYAVRADSAKGGP